MVSHRVEGNTRCADSPSLPLPWVNPNPFVDRSDGPPIGSGSYSRCRPGPYARRPQPECQFRPSKLSVKWRPALRAAEPTASAPAMASGRGLRDGLAEGHLRPWDACSTRPVLGLVGRAVPVLAEQRRALLAHPQGIPRRRRVAGVRQVDEAPISLREPALAERLHRPRMHALGVRGGCCSHRRRAGCNGCNGQRQTASAAPGAAKPRRRTRERYRCHRDAPLRTASRGAPRSAPRWRHTSQHCPG